MRPVAWATGGIWFSVRGYEVPPEPSETSGTPGRFRWKLGLLLMQDLFIGFFLDFINEYFPRRCMLDLGSTSFGISLEAAKAINIPVVKRLMKVKSADDTGWETIAERSFTICLNLSFGNHSSYYQDDHAFKVMKTSSDYDAMFAAWNLEKHMAKGVTTSHLHFPSCAQIWFGQGKIHCNGTTARVVSRAG